MSSETKIILEACVETYQQAISAEANGASRIELCNRLDLGGITPPFDLVIQLLIALKIPIMAMVRPRGGDFVYTEEEFAQMKQEIQQLKELGCQGVVFGLLTPGVEIDIDRTRQLVELARPLQVTFHKAFDDCQDLSKALTDLKETGADRLLTSGGKLTAHEAVPVLNRLLKEAQGNPKLIVAGRVTHENINDLRKLIPEASEFHGRKIVQGI
ncbi:MAG: copper homeostasis protein CutC [Bacteroides sp.]|jgi:copper homeostasis protein|nr:copper homeostasis protein CutC [Bacteroides sp.]